ncbi:hypothetical protein BDR07DRAFT_749884 [Suillus spraguei]|nr:hypothetical protein BDR07DRAFT_749884 [Suillus spraguei]
MQENAARAQFGSLFSYATEVPLGNTLYSALGCRLANHPQQLRSQVSPVIFGPNKKNKSAAKILEISSFTVGTTLVGPRQSYKLHAFWVISIPGHTLLSALIGTF